MKKIPNASVDCFICDLPYGCLHPQTNKTLETSKCKWDTKINLEKFWEQVKRISKNKNTPILMFCNTRFGHDLIKSNESWFRYDLVWDKRRGVSFLSANRMPMKSHEMIYIFSEQSPYYQRVDIKTDKGEWKFPGGGGVSEHFAVPRNTPLQGGKDGMRCPLSVIHFPSNLQTGKHPTEKSVEMYKWLIERYCPVGGTILDPTAGSFNSCLAAMELDRNAIGIEKDEGFYKKAVKKFGEIFEGETHC
jgi:site-specific DNA-methyltransferase (adenine-specific)